MSESVQEGYKERAQRILEHGWRVIQIAHQSANWCIYCNAFIDEIDGHLSMCPYGVLAAMLNENTALIQAIHQFDLADMADEEVEKVLAICKTGRCPDLYELEVKS